MPWGLLRPDTSLTVEQLKHVAVMLDIKRDRVGWPTCCPPSGDKADIVRAIKARVRRQPDAVRAICDQYPSLYRRVADACGERVGELFSQGPPPSTAAIVPAVQPAVATLMMPSADAVPLHAPPITPTPAPMPPSQPDPEPLHMVQRSTQKLDQVMALSDDLIVRAADVKNHLRGLCEELARLHEVVTLLQLALPLNDGRIASTACLAHHGTAVPHRLK